MPYNNTQSIMKNQQQEGVMHPASEPSKIITLNEPVSVTIMRDLSNIFVKLKYAMVPSLRQTAKKELRNWDLWGPMMLCLLLSFTLSLRSASQSKSVITSVFVIMWVGSLIVYLNANFLGSNMSFFQAASLLGYCLFPINLASIMMIFVGGWLPAVFKLVVVFFSFIWSTTCSVAFVGEMIPDKKRKLALYPIALFYLFLSWFVLII